jgi:hypothetical protein
MMGIILAYYHGARLFDVAFESARSASTASSQSLRRLPEFPRRSYERRYLRHK